MGIFKTVPILRVAEARLWRLEAPLVYQADSGEVIVVPEGFITDLASIPKIVRNIIDVNGSHRAAAIIHDYLFVVQDRSLAETNAIFKEAMLACGTGWLTRNAMYLAVCAGGWVPWNDNKEELAIDRRTFLATHGIHIKASGVL